MEDRRLTLTAVLFAGGLSQRMGKDKAMLDIDGDPLWARQIDILRAVQPQVIRVSARARPAWCPPEIDVVLDESPSRGPLSGLAVALSQAETSHVLVLAVDLPRMTSAELCKLTGLIEFRRGVVPIIAGRFEPLCAVYPVEAAAVARGMLAEADMSLQRMIRQLIERRMVLHYEVPEQERSLFHNVNEPSDWKQ